MKGEPLWAGKALFAREKDGVVPEAAGAEEEDEGRVRVEGLVVEAPPAVVFAPPAAKRCHTKEVFRVLM